MKKKKPHRPYNAQTGLGTRHRETHYPDTDKFEKYKQHERKFNVQEFLQRISDAYTPHTN